MTEEIIYRTIVLPNNIKAGDIDIRKGKIYSVYTAVVEFIKFYNKN